MVDNAILYPNEEGGATQVIDKIISSTPRLLAIANLLLAVTYLLYSAVADLFLGSTADATYLQNNNNNNNNNNTNNNNLNDVNRVMLVFCFRVYINRTFASCRDA